MIKRFFTFFCLMMATVAVCKAQSNAGPLVRTHVAQGDIEGVAENGLAVYKGIPYAVPPVGDLRWKDPIPAKSWQGVYHADSWKPMPMQAAQSMPGQKKPNVSEDCLYLNIMTPATKADEKLPVMVWIHGGGFITGSALSPNGTQFAKDGVVYVCIEYRCGAMGFLSLPELTAESPHHTSGNYGLMDQILGLKWVKDNIAAFGGDPNRVTIFGESAGGIAVSMLCASPMAKGLFQGAISESGGSFCPVDSVRHDNNGIRDQKGAEDHGVDFMHRMGASSLKEMRQMDAMKLVSDAQTTGVGGFWPCVDGYVITDDQYKLYQKGDYNDVNVIIGTNSDEGTMFVRPTTVENYQSQVRRDYGPFADRVLKAYPATTEEETFYAQSDIFRETAFSWPSWAWANLQTKTGKSKVYMYYFDVMSPFSFGGPKTKPRGAGHSMEMSYVFNTSMFGPDNRSDEDKAISKEMHQYWLNFARTGNPNGNGLAQWPVYNPDKPKVLYIGKERKATDIPNLDKLQLMEEFFKWKRDNWKR